MPNLLLPDFARALREAPAPKAYICNLMTQPEETEGMDIVRHVEWVSAALGCVPDYVVVNSEPVPDALIARYRLQGAEPLFPDARRRKKLESLGCTVLELPMLSVLDAGSENAVLRHDSAKLAERLFRLCRELEETSGRHV